MIRDQQELPQRMTSGRMQIMIRATGLEDAIGTYWRDRL